MDKNQTLFYINGQWQKPHSRKTLAVINPATQRTVAHIAMGDKTDVNAAVDAADKAFSQRLLGDREQRLALLTRILVLMEKNSDALADAMTMEMGAPYHFARTEQSASGIAHLEIMIETLRTFSFYQRVDNATVAQVPIGVCALITPWNWPINQIACKVFAALAAGCTMVLKPSEIAPLSALLFAQILHEAGVPKGVFNLINGDGQTVGKALASHAKVSMISITGSTRAGIAVAKNAADTVKRVHQELGGNSANIVLADADLSVAVRQGLLSVFSNSGQTCDAPARLLIARAQMPQAIAIAEKIVAEIKVGEPSNPAIDMGPLVSETHFDKVQHLIQLAIDEGATLVAGGVGRPSHLKVGYYCQPTVFANVKHSFRIASEEIFGPVVLMIPYDNEQQAITIANDSAYGLAAYVQSADLKRARQIADQLNAGTVQINYPEANLYVPFGGWKQSGNGREYSRYGLADYLEYKSIIGDEFGD